MTNQNPLETGQKVLGVIHNCPSFLARESCESNEIQFHNSAAFEVDFVLHDSQYLHESYLSKVKMGNEQTDVSLYRKVKF